jgi:hypothetical protein
MFRVILVMVMVAMVILAMVPVVVVAGHKETPPPLVI